MTAKPTIESRPCSLHAPPVGAAREPPVPSVFPRKRESIFPLLLDNPTRLVYNRRSMNPQNLTTTLAEAVITKRLRCFESTALQ